MTGKLKKARRALPLVALGVKGAAKASRWVGRVRGRREARRGAPRLVVFLAGLGTGAVLAYLLGRDSESSELNDPALAAKVQSEIFRPADAPKGTVDVNVENGVVYLRGEVTSRAELKDLIDRAQAVDGVRRAESLLHVTDRA